MRLAVLACFQEKKCHHFVCSCVPLTWCRTICYRKARSPPQIENNIFDELKCEVQAREIRDVATGKLVVCVGFEVTAQLLRHKQEDYV